MLKKLSILILLPLSLFATDLHFTTTVHTNGVTYLEWSDSAITNGQTFVVFGADKATNHFDIHNPFGIQWDIMAITTETKVTFFDGGTNRFYIVGSSQ